MLVSGSEEHWRGKMFLSKWERITVVVALVLIPIAFLLAIAVKARVLVEDAEYWALYCIFFSAALIIVPAMTSQIIRVLDRLQEMISDWWPWRHGL
jgi:hypothetical protein